MILLRSWGGSHFSRVLQKRLILLFHCLRIVLKVPNEKLLIFDPKEDNTFFYHGVKQNNRDFTKKANRDVHFTFDRVFSDESNNQEVFEGTTKEVVDAVLEGFNCSGEFKLDLIFSTRQISYVYIIWKQNSVRLWSHRGRQDAHDAGNGRKSGHHFSHRHGTLSQNGRPASHQEVWSFRLLLGGKRITTVSFMLLYIDQMAVESPKKA